MQMINFDTASDFVAGITAGSRGLRSQSELLLLQVQEIKRFWFEMQGKYQYRW
jgi:hypothetical protein